LFGKLLKPKNKNYQKIELIFLDNLRSILFIMEKKCSKCKILRSISEFGKLKNSSDGLRYDCKICRKKYRNDNKNAINAKLKTYYNDNKEFLLKENAKYRIKNSESIKEQRKEYRNRQEVKEHIKEKNKEYLPIRKEKIKIKRKTDKNFQISEILRSKIHKMLKGLNTSYQNLLGCNLEFFKKWIEFRFEKNMSWDNLGSYWQIDHILPINMFNFIDEKEKNICFHWSNLQPLESNENRSKSDKLQLHYFFNNIVNINRFNSINDKFLGYQAVNESLQWLKKKDFRYGKNPSDKNVLKNTLKMDDPQPSL